MPVIQRPATRGDTARLGAVGLLAAIVAAGSACAPAAEVDLRRGLERVQADAIRNHVAVLAHDSMRGRDTDDVGFERARDYVARQFERIGLEPTEDGTYLQPFELLEVVRDQGSRMTVGGVTFDFPDVIATPDWVGDDPVVRGESAYVGHALVDGSTPPDLGGKIAFVLAGVPRGREEDPDVAQRERAEVELALRAGAVGVVVLNPEGNESAWAARATPRRPTRVLADGTSPTPRPLASLGPAASRRLLSLWESEAVGVVSIERRHETRRVRSWNVVGILPGVDPERTGEAVVFTAHLDHVGIGSPDSRGDSIYNGTHDNALGVANVLAAAEALQAVPTARSIVFLATGAEESGLLGAWYYVRNPVVPLANTAAAINHDGGLVDAVTDDVFAWGPEFSTLEADVEWAAQESGLRLSTEQRPPFGPGAGLLYRSDHYPFLISGVPVLYLMPGFTIAGDSTRGREAWQDYLATIHHGQADDFDPDASFASPVLLTQLTVRLAWRLANADGVPVTHESAPIPSRRGPPSGFFFGDPPF